MAEIWSALAVQSKAIPLGEHIMRSNSGRDKSRNNMRDPTMRDRGMGHRPASAGRAKPKAPADHRGGRKG
jgi:hypothetical protein